MPGAPVKEKALGFLSKLKRFGTKKRVIALVLVVCLIGGILYFSSRMSGKTVAAQQQTTQVTRGDISNTITGTAAVEPVEQYNIVPMVKGEILADYFEEGDMVEEDQLLYQVDTKDVDNSIEKALLSLEKSQQSYFSGPGYCGEPDRKKPVGRGHFQPLC